MNAILDKILSTGYTEAPDGELIETQPVSVPREKGELLQQMLSTLDASTTLEIGLAWGVSALFICDALRDKSNARHIIIDPHQHNVWRGVGLHNLHKAGFARKVEYYELPSYQVLPLLEAQQRVVDFAFIDGWHTFDYALVDFFYVDRILKIGGIIVFDDVDWPSINKVCRFIIANRSYSVQASEVPGGQKTSLRPLLLNMALTASQISEPLQRLLRPEVIRNDDMMRIYGSSIALKKEANDDRRWDYHCQF